MSRRRQQARRRSRASAEARTRLRLRSLRRRACGWTAVSLLLWGAGGGLFLFQLRMKRHVDLPLAVLLIGVAVLGFNAYSIWAWWRAEPEGSGDS